MLWRTPRQPADTRLSGLLRRFCLRVSAPVRLARRLLRVKLLPGKPGPDASQPGTLAAGPAAKELARRVFHRGVRQLLRVPGGRQASRLLRAVAPGPVEFLALRYRAYELRATARPLGSSEVLLFDMSDEEARVYRLFAAHGLAAAAKPQGSDPAPARKAF